MTKPAPKVEIGSKYTGPSFDRPALRKRPDGWYLYQPEDQKRPHVIQRMFEFGACLGCALIAVSVATMIAYWIIR